MNAITQYGLTVWSTQPISDRAVLPDTPPGTTLNLYAQACRGQTVPLSFCIRSSEPCTVKLSVDEGESDVTAWLRWLIPWWQSEKPWHASEYPPVLVPELLVNDPTLVRVLPDKTNEVRQPVLDTVDLEPIDLPANVTQQVWVSVNVPLYCRSKRNPITITVTVGKEAFAFRAVVDVMPFDLAPSPITSSVYYLGRLYGPKDEQLKTEEQYAADLCSMRNHGITAPVCHEDFNVLYRNPAEIARLKKLLGIWREVGLKTETMYIIASPFSGPNTVPRWIEQTRQMLAVLSDNGVKEVYAYGPDEPTAEQMRAHIPRYKAMRDAGLKAFVAVSQRDAAAAQVLGNYLDLVLTANPDADTHPWHDTYFVKIGRYDAVYWIQPDQHFRQFYGLDALASGYDVVCPFAWEQQFGESIWNDVDHYYPDHVLGYPAGHGPLETIWLKGIYEASIDCQYAATLKAVGGEVPEHAGKNLDDVRAEMIRRILAKG
jgi:hypothetical protein